MMNDITYRVNDAGQVVAEVVIHPGPGCEGCGMLVRGYGESECVLFGMLIDWTSGVEKKCGQCRMSPAWEFSEG